MKNPVTVVTTAPENEHLSRVEDAWKTGLHGLSSSADQYYFYLRLIYYVEQPGKIELCTWYPSLYQ